MTDFRARLTAAGVRRDVVEVPDLGRVQVRELSIGAAILFDRHAVEGQALEAMIDLVAGGLLDDDGCPVFDPDEPADRAAIRALGPRVLRPISDAVWHLSGLADLTGPARPDVEGDAEAPAEGGGHVGN